MVAIKGHSGICSLFWSWCLFIVISVFVVHRLAGVRESWNFRKMRRASGNYTFIVMFSIVFISFFIVWRRRAGERARGDPRIFGNRGQPQEVFFQLSLIFAMFQCLAEKGRGKGARESWNSREMRRSSGNYHVVIDCHLSVYSSVFVVFGNRVRTVPKTINK